MPDGDERRAAWDQFFGSPVTIWGRHNDADEKLFACACRLRTAQVTDAEAIEALVGAAGGSRRALRMLAASLGGHRWTSDPLLSRVAGLVASAAAGTPASAVAASDEETVQLERRLLSGSDAQAFALLAQRCPALLELEDHAADPDWVAAAEDDVAYDPPSDQDGFVWAEGTPRFRRWLWGRLVGRLQRHVSEGAQSRELIADYTRYARVAVALQRPLHDLVGPGAVGVDPLLKTDVAYRMVLAHLRAVAGIELPLPPVRPSEP